MTAIIGSINILIENVNINAINTNAEFTECVRELIPMGYASAYYDDIFDYPRAVIIKDRIRGIRIL